MGVTEGWVAIGDRVFVRRYAFYDQNIGVVLGSGEALVIDTRSTYAQARSGGHFRPVTLQAVTSQLAPPNIPAFGPCGAPWAESPTLPQPDPSVNRSPRPPSGSFRPSEPPGIRPNVHQLDTRQECWGSGLGASSPRESRLPRGTSITRRRGRSLAVEKYCSVLSTVAHAAVIEHEPRVEDERARA